LHLFSEPAALRLDRSLADPKFKRDLLAVSCHASASALVTESGKLVFVIDGNGTRRLAATAASTRS
jgi:hypothetical protein